MCSPSNQLSLTIKWSSIRIAILTSLDAFVAKYGEVAQKIFNVEEGSISIWQFGWEN